MSDNDSDSESSEVSDGEAEQSLLPATAAVGILELEFYLFDRQLHNIGEMISKSKIILSGDSHKGTNWQLT